MAITGGTGGGGGGGRGGGSSGSSPPQRQGPQRPGYGFTPGGGSAPIGQGGQGSTSTPQGPQRPIGGGGGGGRGGGSGSAAPGGSSASLIQGPVRPGETSVSGVSIANRPGLNVQAASQAAAKAQADLIRANVNAQDDALNRDSNYAWRTNAPLKENIVGAYKAAESFVSEKISKPLLGEYAKAETQAKFAPSAIGIGPFGLKSEYLSKAFGGFQSSILTPYVEKPLTTGAKDALTFGIGAGVGLGVKGVTFAASSVPKVGGYLASGIRVTELGAGATLGGLYAIGKTKEVMAAETPGAKGEVIGKGIKEAALFGSGYGAGQKAFDIGKSYIRTIGASPLKQQPLQGEFPQAPTSKQLGMFEKNIFPEISEKPIAFHTTSQKFWQGGTISPKTGTSELPGLYASTQISTPFSRISGSGSGVPSTPKLWLESLKKSIKEPVGRPAVVALEPKGFREVKYGYSGIKQFEGQKAVGGKYAYFKTKEKAGYLDIPKMKTEIEAIARPKAGDYGVVSDKKFYVTIKGERVPLDVAKYKPGTGISRGGKAPRVKPLDVAKYGTESLYYPRSYATGIVTSFAPYKGSSPKSQTGSSLVSKPSDLTSLSPSRPSGQPPSYGGNKVTSKEIYGSGASSLISGYASISSPYKEPLSSTVPSLGGFGIGKPRPLGMKSKEVRIAPSFSAIVGNKYATEQLKVSKTLGVNPFQTRGQYTEKVGPKGYYKLTDL